MYELDVRDVQIQLLPQKAAFVPSIGGLLVSDVHLGKSETFQAFGIPIPNQVNSENLARLLNLCEQYTPDHLFILGDLFHSPHALTENVIRDWVDFVNAVDAEVHLIVGNHDRSILGDLENLLIQCHSKSVAVGGMCFSHEPMERSGDDDASLSTILNICGHVHPCVRLRSPTDDLRLPCFYLEEQAHRLTLPSFGAFTGGYEVSASPGNHAYAIADNTIVAFESPLLHEEPR